MLHTVRRGSVQTLGVRLAAVSHNLGLTDRWETQFAVEGNATFLTNYNLCHNSNNILLRDKCVV